ncbi:hypothetical protein HY933_02910 [Candidatus Falkowbacteria bacterium]|nr:hypothetical protein [Candidatus Falkowbacteria bacterium]
MRSDLLVGALEDKWLFLSEQGVEAAYLLMMGMARNLTDLERLHVLLPSNARLLRKDWLEFKQLWRNTCESDAFGGTRVVDDLAQVMLRRALIVTEGYGLLTHPHKCKTLCAYYRDRLREGREQLPMDTSGPYHQTILIRFGEALPRGERQDGLLVNVHGQQFAVKLIHNPAIKELEIWLVCWEYQLTELLTHQLRQLPPFKVNILQCISNGSYELGMGYTVPDTLFVDVLKTVHDQRIAKDGEEIRRLLGSLTAALHHVGLSITTQVYVGSSDHH